MLQNNENKRQWLFILILSGLMGCTTLSTDIYLPAMPTMEKALGGNVEFYYHGGSYMGSCQRPHR